mgnify:CR=1 FL=1
MKDIFFLIVSFCFFITHAQTKVGGIVIDEQGEPVSFANVLFKNSCKQCEKPDLGEIIGAQSICEGANPSEIKNLKEN